MEHFYHNIGEDWFSYPQLYKRIVDNSQDGAHIVEVGSWKGRSASFMAVEIINSNKKIKFDNNQIYSISSSSFLGLNELEKLHLVYNKCSNIEPAVFYNLKNLRKLDLSMYLTTQVSII